MNCFYLLLQYMQASLPSFLKKQNYKPVAYALLLLLQQACGDFWSSTPAQTPATNAFEKQSIQEDDLSPGTSLYITLCEHIAANSGSSDIDGQRSLSICHSDNAPIAKLDGSKLLVLHSARKHLIHIFDAILSANPPKDLHNFLKDFLENTQTQTLKDSSRSLADFLEDIQQQPVLLSALANWYNRQGDDPSAQHAHLVRSFLTYPRLQPLLETLHQQLQLNPDIHRIYQEGLQELQQAGGLATWLREVADWGQAIPNSFKDGFAQSLLSSSPLQTTKSQLYTHYTPLWLPLHDVRGLPLPAQQGEKMVAPFSDTDEDGYADADLYGRFLNQQHRPIHLPTPMPASSLNYRNEQRDIAGRALDPHGQLLYQYIDLRQTLLADLLQASKPWLEASSDLLWLLPEQLLNAIELLEQQPAYQPLLRKIWQIVGKILLMPESKALLEVLSQMAEKEPERFFDLFEKLSQSLEQLIQPTQDGTNPKTLDGFFIELQAITERLFHVPGLVEDLLQSLRQPEIQNLGTVLAHQMLYKDAIALDHNNINAPPLGVMQTPVDRLAPESFYNQSLLQRTLHLTDSCHWASLCSKPQAQVKAGPMPLWRHKHRCELFEVPDMTIFYIQSIAYGQDKNCHKCPKATLRLKPAYTDYIYSEILDSYFSYESGIQNLGLHPTPQAINRLLFSKRNDFLNLVIETPRGHDHLAIEDEHPNTIFVWELEGFYDAIRPLLQPFADRDEEAIAADIFSLLHRHWSSEKSNLRSLEPALAAILGEKIQLLSTLQKFLEGLHHHQATLYGAKRKGDDIFSRWLSALNKKPQKTLSIQQELLTSLKKLSVLPKPPTSKDQTNLGLKDLYQIGKTLFAQKQIRGASEALFRLLFADGCRRANAIEKKELDLLERYFFNPNRAMSKTPLRLLQALSQETDLRHELTLLLLALLQNDPPYHHQDALLISTAKLIQESQRLPQQQQLFQELLTVLDKNPELLSAMANMMHQAYALDNKHILPKLMASMAKIIDVDGRMAYQILAEVFISMNRHHVGKQQALNQQDIYQLLHALSEFLRNPDNGIERLYLLLSER